ncbi:MAG: hypothetical protein MHPSP_004389, partial [Paramarteilia canceri]
KSTLQLLKTVKPKGHFVTYNIQKRYVRQHVMQNSTVNLSSFDLRDFIQKHPQKFRDFSVELQHIMQNKEIKLPMPEVNYMSNLAKSLTDKSFNKYMV